MNCSEVQQLHCSTKLFQFSISLICLILFDMITNPSGLCLCKLLPLAIGTIFYVSTPTHKVELTLKMITL